MELSTTFFLLYYSPKKRIFQAISFVFEKLRVWILLWKQSGKTGIVWRKKETPSDDREKKRGERKEKKELSTVFSTLWITTCPFFHNSTLFFLFSARSFFQEDLRKRTDCDIIKLWKQNFRAFCVRRNG